MSALTQQQKMQGGEASPATVRLPSLDTDVVNLALALVDTCSVSWEEAPLADAIEEALRGYDHLEVIRCGNTVVARTSLGRAKRVIVAGHIDTVPLADNCPGKLTIVAGEEHLWGRGSVDMKGGVATHLHLAATLCAPVHDVTWIFYDREEIEAQYNGLGLLAAQREDLLRADLAILGEPTAGNIEGGCNGTIRVRLDIAGLAAHSARAWCGVNAVHRAAPVLALLAGYQPRTVQVDGLDYRESLGVVHIEGGQAKNSVPESCRIWVNYRFAPAMSGAQALAYLEDIFKEFDMTLTVEDLAQGARPGLTDQLALEFVSAAKDRGALVGPKYGWTDVSRFSSLGVPALNFGPGDPMQAHTAQESCPTAQIRLCTEVLGEFLGGRIESREMKVS